MPLDLLLTSFHSGLLSKFLSKIGGSREPNHKNIEFSDSREPIVGMHGNVFYSMIILLSSPYSRDAYISY